MLVNLRLERNDVGQMLDGLIVRRDAWQATAEYLETGYNRDDVMIEECSEADEAKAIAAHYNQLIDTISAQLREQTS